MFASCDVGICKPSPEFYRRIEQSNLAQTGEIFVMVDDDQRNVEAAVSMGWRGVNFDPDLNESHTLEYLTAELLGRLR